MKVTKCTRLHYKCLVDDTNQKLWRSWKESPGLGNQGDLTDRLLCTQAGAVASVQIKRWRDCSN